MSNWKKQQNTGAKYFCKPCAVWIQNNSPSISLHNQGKSHLSKVNAAVMSRLAQFTASSVPAIANSTPKDSTTSTPSSENRFAASLGVYATKFAPNSATNSTKAQEESKSDENTDNENTGNLLRNIALIPNPEIKQYLDHVNSLNERDFTAYAQQCEESMGIELLAYLTLLNNNLYNLTFSMHPQFNESVDMESVGADKSSEKNEDISNNQQKATILQGTIQQWEETDVILTSQTKLHDQSPIHLHKKQKTNPSNTILSTTKSDSNSFVQLMEQQAPLPTLSENEQLSLSFKKKKRKIANLSFD